MCGIFGYSGHQNPKYILLTGLKRLEYRGYDSWGISYKSPGSEIILNKEIGHIPEINKDIDSGKGEFVGIAHTRWATHGGVTKVNAHPHFSSDKSFSLAQNGIVENYQELKESLQKDGYKFISDTDTEVIVRLIESELKNTKDLLEATIQAFSKLKGRNTIILLSEKDEIIAIKHGSPLVIGKGDGEIFIGSDYLSFANYTQEIMEMNDETGVYIKDGKIKKFAVRGSEKKKLDLDFHTVDEIPDEVDKGGFPDFMLKEIHEQPQTIMNSTSYEEKELEPLMAAIKTAENVYLVGCGTASYAAGQIAYFLRKYVGVRAIELKGYEMDSYRELFTRKDLMIAISQSGETADTIEPIEHMKKAGGKVASLVNMVGSTITKISDYAYLSRTGPEICVASTKAFTAQLAWGFLLSQALVGRFKEAKQELKQAQIAMNKLLEDDWQLKTIKKIVDYCKTHEHFFVLGRGQNFYISLEGALKIKEITYKHFEGFAAGELKHGVIALVEEGTPVFSIISEDESEADMISATAEVKTRGAKVIAVAPDNNDLFDFHIKTAPLAHTSGLLNVIPFQLISYYLGKSLGNNVDKPRNLAKSVTVK